MRTSTFVLLLGIPFTAVAANGQSFAPIGPRAAGFGGAYVALAADPSAGHWNPAGLALVKPGGVFVYGETGRVRDDFSSHS